MARRRPTYSGSRFREVREATGVRRADLARAAKCSLDHLRLFEQEQLIHGKPRNISPELAHTFANTLSRLASRTITVEDFLGNPLDDAAAAA